MLNRIWGAFFVAAFLVALFRWLVLGDPGVWAAMVGAAFDLAETGFRIALGLTGVMCLWLGVMRLGEAGGALDLLLNGVRWWVALLGADSFAGRLVSVIQGSTETTFYVLAVYFGSVNIRNTRHAVGCGLAADAGGIVAAILVAYLSFG